MCSSWLYDYKQTIPKQLTHFFKIYKTLYVLIKTTILKNNNKSCWMRERKNIFKNLYIFYAIRREKRNEKCLNAVNKHHSHLMCQ